MSALVLVENKNTYEQFLKKTVPHTRGFFVWAPSGAGKTYYIQHQQTAHWIDGDDLWKAAGAQPDTDWWNQGLDVIHEVDAKSDVITQEAKRLGLWILGASNYWLRPDAIVLPDLRLNIKRIGLRQSGDYDGGATLDKLQQLKNHRAEMRSVARKKKVPIFKTIEEAVAYIEKMYREGQK